MAAVVFLQYRGLQHKPRPEASKRRREKLRALQQVDGVVDQNRAQDTLGFRQHVLQRFLNVLLGVRQRHYADRRTLPHVVKIEFRDGDVELAAQAVLEASQNLTLVFQRASVRDVQFERQQADGHNRRKRGGQSKTAARVYLRAPAPACTAASAPLSFTTLKASRTSPTFTSLKLATPTPHSNPVRTSLASSLKRLSELSFDVYTTAPSRTTRTCASRFSTPSTT